MKSSNPSRKINEKQKSNKLTSKNINYLILILLVYIIKYKLNDQISNQKTNKDIKVNNGDNQKNKEKNFIRKIKYTAEGVKTCFQNDVSIIFAYSISVPLSILHFVFAPNLLTKIIGLIIYSLLIIFETLNTSIEATVDRIGLEYHTLSKVAKDTATVPSAIVTIIIFISSCLFGLNIHINYNQWESKYLENNQDLTDKQKKKYILVGKYIIQSFKN